MEFQLSYFRSWKMMLWKCYTQYASKFGKLSSGHRTRKGQISFQFQRKVVPKNVQTTTQLHSSHRLAKWCSKFSKPGFNSTWTVGRGTRDQIANICWIIKIAREFQKNINFCFIDYTKPLTVWITIYCGKFWRRWDTRPRDLPFEKPVCRSGSNI